MNKIKFSKEFDCSAKELFKWHSNKGALERLTPYWEKVRVKEQFGTIRNGDWIKLSISLGGIPLTWHLTHVEYQEGEQFCDQQAPGLLSGPFNYWKHKHIIRKLDDNKSILEDKINYKFHLGFLGKILTDAFIKAKLERLFRYRYEITKGDIQNSKLLKKEIKPMKILIAGSSGLVGNELVDFLKHQGHEVVKLIRSKNKINNSIYWNPELGELDENSLEAFDAVINLAGENIANKRWTKQQKQKIKESRIKSTTLLSNKLSRLKNPPKVFICASAIGFYGDRPFVVLNEDSYPAKGDFLSETCKEWEAATNPAAEAGIRVINARFGIILSPKGGALAKLLLPFQLGLGGILGDGKQVMSWIALDDVIYAINYLLQDDTIAGPVNFTSPEPVTNLEFTKTLGKVLSRPTIFPVPAFAAKLAFGEMAEALLLSSARVQPVKLVASRFKYAYPDLESALKHLLGK
jgi:uncharacterized protein